MKEQKETPTSIKGLDVSVKAYCFFYFISFIFSWENSSWSPSFDDL